MVLIDAQNIHIQCFNGLESGLRSRVNEVMEGGGKNDFLDTNCKSRESFVKALAWNYFFIMENIRLDDIRCPKCGAYALHIYDTVVSCNSCSFHIQIHRVIEDAFKLLEE